MVSLGPCLCFLMKWLHCQAGFLYVVEKRNIGNFWCPSFVVSDYREKTQALITLVYRLNTKKILSHVPTFGPVTTSKRWMLWLSILGCKPSFMMEKWDPLIVASPPPTTRITGRGREAAPTMNRGLLSAEEGAGRNNSSTATVIIIHGLGGESLFYIFS